ncbi:protein networked 3a-related [Anaeramoeba ignava]|uniref:Protein networked 3a-related n=1 Tax=Anaeramoeba ignava TaxID=1746090 RepID=A0A9Q0LUB0_ANAIG|nr:protein networked 3a-related [Anaeramoeba ignava]
MNNRKSFFALASLFFLIAIKNKFFLFDILFYFYEEIGWRHDVFMIKKNLVQSNPKKFFSQSKFIFLFTFFMNYQQQYQNKKIEELEEEIKQLNQEIKVVKEKQQEEKKQEREKTIFSQIVLGIRFSQIEELETWMQKKEVNSHQYYGVLKRIDEEVEQILKDEFWANVQLIKQWKQKNPQEKFVLAYDGRWSSRRNANEGTVSFICVEGPEEKKPCFFEDQTDFKKGSSAMEGKSAEKSMEIFMQFGVIPDIVVHDRDSSSFGNMKIICDKNQHKLEELFDPNHWFKNFHTKLVNYIKTSQYLRKVLRYFKMIISFPIKLRQWFDFCRRNCKHNYDTFCEMVLNSISHWSGHHKNCLADFCKADLNECGNEFLSKKNEQICTKVKDKKERDKLLLEAKKELEYFIIEQLKDAIKIVHPYSSNIVECWNHSLTKMVPKNQNFWKYYTARLSVSALRWNKKTSGIFDLASRLGIVYTEEEKTNINNFYLQKENQKKKPRTKKYKKKEKQNKKYYYKKDQSTN